jgi:hypothetical protein
MSRETRNRDPLVIAKTNKHNGIGIALQLRLLLDGPNLELRRILLKHVLIVVLTACQRVVPPAAVVSKHVPSRTACLHPCHPLS